MRLSTIALMFVVGSAGCPSGDDGGDAGNGTEAPTTSGSPTDTGTSTGTDAATLTASSSETGLATMDCEDARTEAECNALAQTIYGCGWLASRRWAIADGTCEDMDMAGGRCLKVEEESGCGDLVEPNCPDGLTTVLYDSNDVVGNGVELWVTSDQVCVGLPGLTPCGFDPDGGTGTGTTGGTATSGGIEPTWDPAECACACPS